MSEKVYKDDVGTVMVIDCGTDISTATIHALSIKKPSGDRVVWEGEVYQNNYIKYVVAEGDLDEEGEYEGNAYVQLPSWKGRGNTFAFDVHEWFA